MLDLRGHAAYWATTYPKKKSKEKYSYKRFFFPAIQMNSLLETAGQR